MAPHRVHFRKTEAKSSGRGALVCAASELMRTIWFWYRRITAPYRAPVAMSRVRPTKIHRFGDIVNPSHPPQARLVSASPLSNRRIMPGDVNHRSALFTPADANAATRESFCPTARWRGREVRKRYEPFSHLAARACPKEQQNIPHPAFPVLGAKGHVPEHQTVVQLRPSRNRRGGSGCLPPIRTEDLGIQQAVPGQRGRGQSRRHGGGRGGPTPSGLARHRRGTPEPRGRGCARPRASRRTIRDVVIDRISTFGRSSRGVRPSAGSFLPTVKPASRAAANERIIAVVDRDVDHGWGG